MNGPDSEDFGRDDRPLTTEQRLDKLEMHRVWAVAAIKRIGGERAQLSGMDKEIKELNAKITNLMIQFAELAGSWRRQTLLILGAAAIAAADLIIRLMSK